MTEPVIPDLPDLADRRVVVPGGTGGVGEGIVRALVAAGADVIVPSRSVERVAEFRGLLGDVADAPNLHLIEGSYRTFDEAERLAGRIASEFGPITDVVASIGGWWGGKGLWQVSEADWQTYFVDLTTSHMAVLRGFLPLLPPEGTYTLILGGSAMQPVPGSGIISMEQAALLMMHRVLAAEVGEQRRVHSMVLGPVMTRTRHGQGDPDWVTAEEVGLVVAELAAHPQVGSLEVGLRTHDDVRNAISSIERAVASATTQNTEPDPEEQA